MQKYILYTIIFFFSCTTNTIETTKQALTEFDINLLSDDQLGDVLSQQLKEGDLIPSIRKLWKQREVDKRFLRLITPHNIVLWIKKRNLGINSIPAPRIHTRVGGLTPLMQAIQLNDLEVLEILLKGGSDINESVPRKGTALGFAASQGKLEAIKLILATPGANINKQDNNGLTALMRAVGPGHQDAVALLLKYCPDIYLKTFDTSENFPNMSVLEIYKDAEFEGTKLSYYLIRGYEIGHKSCNTCKK